MLPLNVEMASSAASNVFYARKRTSQDRVFVCRCWRQDNCMSCSLSRKLKQTTRKIHWDAKLPSTTTTMLLKAVRRTTKYNWRVFLFTCQDCTGRLLQSSQPNKSSTKMICQTNKMFKKNHYCRQNKFDKQVCILHLTKSYLHKWKNLLLQSR